MTPDPELREHIARLLRDCPDNPDLPDAPNAWWTHLADAILSDPLVAARLGEYEQVQEWALVVERWPNGETYRSVTDDISRSRLGARTINGQQVQRTAEALFVVRRQGTPEFAAGEGDTERCPTCGETAEWDWIAAPCPDRFHRATDTEATS